jgi:hypothetical protein
MIKFIDVQRINAKFEKKIKDIKLRFFNIRRIICIKEYERFEKEFSNFCLAIFCIGIAKGPDILTIIFNRYLPLEKIDKFLVIDLINIRKDLRFVYNVNSHALLIKK